MRKHLILSIVGMLVLVSCQTNNSSSDVKKPQDTATKPTIPQPNSPLDDADLLPNLLQIGSIFKNSDLSYFADLTTPVSDLTKLNTQYDRSITLGVYIADLSYCTLNKQKSKTGEYLKAVKELSDNIGLGSIFGSGNFSKRYEANMDNEDSLAGIVADLQMRTDDILAKNKQNSIRVIIYSGAWIESMNVATKVYIKNKTSTASGHISEQINILENILKVLAKYKDADSRTGSLCNNLRDLDNAYANFNEVKSFDPSKSQAITLTDDHIAQFSEMIEKLHNKITAMQ